MNEKAESFEAFNRDDHPPLPLPVIVEVKEEKAVSFTWDADEPLGRRAGESRKANAALHDYHLMGAGRSLRKLWRRYRTVTETSPGQELPPTRRLPTLKGWSVRFHWQERVGAAEALDAAERRRTRLERQIEVDDRDWDLGGELRDLAQAILDEGPKYLRARHKFIKGTGGKPDREIITVALDAPTAIRAAKLASDMQRAATGLGKRVARESWNVDLATLTIGQLTRLAAGEDLIDVLLAPEGDGGAGASPETG